MSVKSPRVMQLQSILTLRLLQQTIASALLYLETKPKPYDNRERTASTMKRAALSEELFRGLEITLGAAVVNLELDLKDELVSNDLQIGSAEADMWLDLLRETLACP